MALEGSIQEFGLADILQLLYLQKKTGVLNVTGKSDEVKIFFNDGNISDIVSQKISSFKRLSEIFIKNGIITKNKLDSIKSLQKKEGLKSFVSSNLVSEYDFLHGMEDLVIDTLVYIFSWTEGTYEFVIKKSSDVSAVSEPLDTQQLLMESMRIVDELLLIEGQLDLDVVYARSETPQKETLGISESRVFTLIDGKKNISQLIDEAGMEYLETAKSLLSLAENEFITPVIKKPLITEKILLSDKKTTIIYNSILIIFFSLLTIIVLRGVFNFFHALSEADKGAQLEIARLVVDKYYLKYGKFPENLHNLPFPLDPWGKPYVYNLTDKGFQLFSAGLDGVEGTDDDVY